MESRFIIAVLSVFAVATQANAACHLLPPPCALAEPLQPPSLAALLPTLLGALGPALPLAQPPSTLALPSVPAALPCPVPPTQVANKPDVNIPLPLPAEIPVGKFCTCQKFSIKPALLPCAPPPTPCAAVLPPPPPLACLPPSPPLALLPTPPPTAVFPPALLQTLLGALVPPPPSPCAPCACV